MGFEDTPAEVQVDEQVVLKKFEGDPKPENEFERVTIQNGEVVAHERVENGEVVGPVADEDSIVGANVGSLIANQTAEGDN